MATKQDNQTMKWGHTGLVKNILTVFNSFSKSMQSLGPSYLGAGDKVCSRHTSQVSKQDVKGEDVKGEGTQICFTCSVFSFIVLFVISHCISSCQTQLLRFTLLGISFLQFLWHSTVYSNICYKWFLQANIFHFFSFTPIFLPRIHSYHYQVMIYLTITVFHHPYLHHHFSQCFMSNQTNLAFKVYIYFFVIFISEQIYA